MKQLALWLLAVGVLGGAVCIVGFTAAAWQQGRENFRLGWFWPGAAASVTTLLVGGWIWRRAASRDPGG